jgi:prepilin-type N-terminal cleavage/methylation domain-containing protein
MKRAAFTMIELIITIVIIGIVSLSFPLIMTQTGNNILVAAQQEAVLAAKTYIGTILSYPWDDNTYAEGSLTRGMILETDGTSADDEFNRVVDTNFRAGSIAGDNRRRLIDNSTINKQPTTSGAGGDWGGNDVDDIDDFNDKTQDLNVASSDMDYIFQLRLTPTVSYVSDEAVYTSQNLTFAFNTGSVGITNIKMVSMNVVNATASAPNVNIVLRAYSSNIGEIELLERGRGSW